MDFRFGEVAKMRLSTSWNLFWRPSMPVHYLLTGLLVTIMLRKKLSGLKFVSLMAA